MGDKDYSEVPLAASGIDIELGEPIAQPTSGDVGNSEPASFANPDDMGHKYASLLVVHAKSPEEHDKTRRISDADSMKIYHQGIYWRSPITMATFFFIGVIICVGHHLYYNSLVGQAVGDVNDQQRVLRYGTTFAFLAQVSLVSSVGFAFTQVLWRTLKNTEFSIEGIDAVFDVRSTLLSFLNLEMLWKMRVGSLIALIAWCLPISGLITPATIFVNPSSSLQMVTAPVRRLDILGPNQTGRFTYSVPAAGPNTHNGSIEVFLGPRTIISRLSVATATLGEILPIAPPFANASYQLQFYGPTVQCGDANSSVSATIDSLLQEQESNSPNGASEVENYYFAFVPELNGPGTEAIVANRFQQPANASNQLWMTFQRYVIDSTGERVPQPRHLVCQLYNASYDLTLSFVESSQTITRNSLKILNTVDYPTVDPSTPSDLVQHAYSAYMWALTDELIGWIGIYNDTSLSNSSSGGITEFSEIQTQIEHTSLLGSSDLDYFFDKNHELFVNTTTHPNTDQRNRDIALARNHTLDVLIPELAFNITVSFMTSDLLSPPTNTSVLTTVSVNLYAYHSINLFLAYGIAILFALLANILGGLAYHYNQVSHDTSFSSILSSTRDPGLAELFDHQVLGKLPLPRDIEKAKLKFGKMKEGGLGFHRVIN